ncbi:RagB/SusD family nutrient uptake outer membrane protein [Flavobacterium pectinovorum]|uniref:RagB/SusD family nutrient uptake outer membrane protein n=1 Tax=Flavobacterium pectinovorum TaxID=29533 RepID=UPI001FAE6623|nr:RagB/SusD family nutrient uptake outer membrane protein [Flavobacterium pectinovorum]MCI9846699.1 RagB/SusD family nutrient uptake outer membrane protein [Flavobacterium pectinovorum]
MKSIKNIFYASIALLALSGCDDLLEENVYSELTPGNFLTTLEGKNAVLNSAYGNSQAKGIWAYFLSPYVSGEQWNRGGSVESLITPLSNFTWDSNHEWFSQSWSQLYAAIRDANIVIDNTSTTNDKEKSLNAEARFVRALSFSYLYNWYGPVPLIVSSKNENLQLPRPTDDEFKSFIEKEFLEVSELLPVKGAQNGRATKGGALGLLCKFYLNTKQWQKSADIANQIILSKTYDILPDYKSVFALNNEWNKEILWATSANGQSGHILVALTFPTDYPLPFSNNQVFAARSYLFDSYVNSFAPSDVRKNLFITKYTNTSGTTFQLLGNDQTFSYKYEFDPNSVGATQGNDLPEVRYSDILLSYAEALNELNGPTEEAIKAINKVRFRAGISLIDLADYNKESLRDLILQERSWEFYGESKSREDQIRHNKFITGAIARGKKAQAFHVLFPIPLTELNANPNLDPNFGY